MGNICNTINNKKYLQKKKQKQKRKKLLGREIATSLGTEVKRKKRSKGKSHSGPGYLSSVVRAWPIHRRVTDLITGQGQEPGL